MVPNGPIESVLILFWKKHLAVLAAYMQERFIGIHQSTIPIHQVKIKMHQAESESTDPKKSRI